MTSDLDTGAISPRRLIVNDADGGHRLSAQAGWNQTVHDWRLMIESGQGIGFVDTNDVLIATAVLVPYRSDIDWVSMILVDEEWRGRGLGLRLTQLIVELSLCPVLGLDATELGIGIYRKLGFRVAEQITRFRREAGVADIAGADSTQVKAPPESSFRSSLSAFVNEGEPVRTDLLCDLDTGGDGRFCLVRGDKTAAVVVLREGRRAVQVGPLFATDASSATTLLRWIAARRAEPLIIDAFDSNSAFVQQLSELGFSPTRSFTRMFRGGLPPRNTQEYAVAGPEFG